MHIPAVRPRFALASGALVVLASVVSAPTPAHAASNTWDGGDGTSTLYTEPSNWEDNIAPADGQSVTFPANAPHKMVSMQNGAKISGLFLGGGGYTFTGGVQTTGSMIFQNDSGTTDFKASITAPDKLFIRQYPNGVFDQINGIVTGPSGMEIDNYGTFLFRSGLNAPSLKITGYGDTYLRGGNIQATAVNSTNAGRLILGGTGWYGPFIVGAGTLGSEAFSARVGALTVNGGILAPGSARPGVGDYVQLDTGDLVLGAAARFRPSIIGPFPTQNDVVQVKGSVTLAGALDLAITTGLPFGIPSVIIANDGADQVVGTFAGIPEGGTVVSGVQVYKVSYQAGDGNDVAITRQADVVPPTTTSTSTSSTTTSSSTTSSSTTSSLATSTTTTTAGTGSAPAAQPISVSPALVG